MRAIGCQAAQVKKVLVASLGAIALTMLAGSPSWGEDTETLPMALELLRSLIIEAHSSLESGPPEQPRLYAETIADERTIMEYLVDEIGFEAVGTAEDPVSPPNAAALDEVVTILLAEAEWMKEKAAAATDQDAIDRYRSGRKHYLEASARALAFYRVAAIGVYGTTAAGLEEPSELPDWTLPGGLEIRKIGGAARINVRTADFSGRMSGALSLPQFRTMLNVPNASFDSRGNFDLTAYGQTAFPPDAQTPVQLIVPARRPLTLHLSDSGAFRAAGGLRVVLPDRNQFEAYFDVADPLYQFGFSYSGGLTLKLAQELTLLRPVIDFGAAEPLTLDAIDGLGQFFGSLSKGIEIFVGDSPDLPSPAELSVGVAPDFRAPETVIPFDVFDAWITCVGNEVVRPLVNGSIADTVGPVRDALADMRSALSGIYVEQEPTLNEISRMRRTVELNSKIKQLLKDGAAVQAIGGDASKLQNDAEAAATEAVKVARDYLDNTPGTADFKTGFAAVQLYMEAAANAALLGSDADFDAGDAAAKVEQWTASALQPFGINGNGTVATPDKVAALHPSDLLALVRMAVRIDANEEEIGEDITFERARNLLRLAFNASRDAYNTAIANDDLETRALEAVRLLDIGVVQDQLGADFSADEEKLMYGAFNDTFHFVADGNGGGREKTAGSLLEAARHEIDLQNEQIARRVADVFGDGTTKPAFAATKDFSSYDYSFLQKIEVGARALAALGDGSGSEGIKTSTGSFLDQYREAIDEEFKSGETVAQNMRGSMDALKNMIDSIAWIEANLPDDDTGLLGKFTNSWQALHVQWTGVAEAQKAGWYLAAYMQELSDAANRYGNGVSDDLRKSFEVAGTEAAEGLTKVADAMAGLLGAIDAEAFTIKLPGDLVIKGFTGQLSYDREHETWNIGLGGRLEFPDSGASFWITQGTFDSAGNFVIDAGAQAMNLSDTGRAQFTGTIHVEGGPDGLGPVSGSGDLTVHIDAVGDQPAADVTYTGDISYDPDEQGKPLKFHGAFSQTQGEVKFCDDFVLFDGDVDVTIATAQPDLKVGMSGKAGFFHRDDPPAGGDREGNFWTVLDIDQFALEFNSTGTKATFSGGKLYLAGDIFNANDGESTRVFFGFDNDLVVEVSSSGALNFHAGGSDLPFEVFGGGFHFSVPGIPASKIAINNCALQFYQDQFPVLKELNASFEFPLPSEDVSDPSKHVVALHLDVEDWRVDGFPPASATLTLQQGADLMDINGFALSLMGANDVIPGCSASAMSLTTLGSGVQKYTRMRLDGGLWATFRKTVLGPVGNSTLEPGDGTEVVSISGGEIRAGTCGYFQWDFKPDAVPKMGLEAMEIEGKFKLGTSPFNLSGARDPNTGAKRDLAILSIPNFDTMLKRTTAEPFVVDISGALDVPELGSFELNGLRFIWDDPNDLMPRFESSGGGLAVSDESSDILGAAMPVRITEFNLAFKDPSLPLIPLDGSASILNLTNIRITVSAEATIPPITDPFHPPSVPTFNGTLKGLTVEYPDGNPLAPKVCADAVIMQLGSGDKLDIPPLNALSGSLAWLNLSALCTNPPKVEDVVFVGQLSGKLKFAKNGIGVSVLFAGSPKGILGGCEDIEVGATGIPVDGMALGGIMLSGGKLGFNFNNRFGDPCEFSSYIDLDNGTANFPQGQGNAPPSDILANPEPKPEGLDEYDMLGDHWPPRSANPLCDEVTNRPGSFVFKGTRMKSADAETFLNMIQLTDNTTATPDQVADLVISNMMAIVQDAALTALDSLYAASATAVGEDNVDTRTVDYIRQLTQNILDSFDEASAPILRAALQAASSAGASMRGAVKSVLTSGLPCFNVTVTGAGTFTYQPTAGALSLVGEMTFSTTGAAMLRGTLNLGGIPVGEGSLGISLTNEKGEIDPFLGGLLHVGLGPIELGKATMAVSCPGCIDGLMTAFTNYVTCVGGVADDQIKRLIEDMQGGGFTFPEDTSVVDYVLQMTDQERMSLITAMAMYFQAAHAGALPEDRVLSPDVYNDFLICFEDFLVEVANKLYPDVGIGGKVAPVLFGIPMTGGADALVGARMHYGIVPTESDPSQKEMSGSFMFSPTFLILSPLMASAVSSVPLVAPFVGFTAVDEAEMSFSLRIHGYTREMIHELLTAPPVFIANQTQTFFEDAVFAAGYTMKPFGMELANGEMRILMPHMALHPLNPQGNNYGWTAPPADHTKGLPTSEELILAAVASHKMADASWRGEAGNLDDVFQEGAVDTHVGCSEKTAEVGAELREADPDLNALAKCSFASNYFPYGGIIGGGQLEVPKILTQGIPPAWGDLMAATDDLFANGQFNSDAGQEWLTALQSVLDFLASSECVGQLGFYLPAPNPILLPSETEVDWSTMSVTSFMSRLTVDPLALVNRSVNTDLYPLDQILFGGWADAKFLGLDIARAEITYDAPTHALLAEAHIPSDAPEDADNWMKDYVDASATIRILPPRFGAPQAVGSSVRLTAVGTAELFKYIGQVVAQKPNPQGPDLENLIQQIQDSLLGTLPRMSMETDAGVKIPPELSHVLQKGTGELGIFAFSPYFEPDYETGDFSPYAYARRRGGMGIHGALKIGYFPDEGEPIEIDVDGSLALTPSADIAVFPAVSGELLVPSFDVPGAPSFHDGVLVFASSPDDGAPYLDIEGTLDPFVFSVAGNDLLKAAPLAPATNLTGHLVVTREGMGMGVDLGLSAMSASMPFLGSDVAVVLYGGLDAGGSYTGFTFSTQSKQPWSAQMALCKPDHPTEPPTFGISDPQDPDRKPLLTFTPAAPVTGGISGKGLDSFSAYFEVPTGFQLVLFPGTPNETKVDTPEGDSFVCAFDSRGRFYCNLGDFTDLKLPGLITAHAKIEFGFNPDDPAPDVAVEDADGNAPDFDFGATNLVDSGARQFVVRNQGTLSANVGLSLIENAQSPDFLLSAHNFQIEPGAARTVQIVFQPRSAGVHAGTLRVTSNDPDSPTQDFAVAGEGLREPRFFVSRPSVTFGDTVIGGTSHSTLTVGNDGSADMVIRSVLSGNSVFAVTPDGETTVAPGEEVLYQIDFSPTELGSQAAQLEFTVADPIGATNVALDGAGTQSRWVTVLDAEAAGRDDDLNAIKMLDSRRGFAAGNEGTFLETRDGGRSWIPRKLTLQNLNGFAMTDSDDPDLSAVAVYHLDDPVGTPTYVDSSINALNGMPAANAPVLSFNYGQFGSGLHFDGTNQYALLGAGILEKGKSFAISMWIKPDKDKDGQAYLANNTASAANRFIFGRYYGSLHINIADQKYTSGVQPPLETWSHCVINAECNAAGDQTTVTLYLNGQVAGSGVLNAVLDPSDQRWTLGQELDPVTGGGTVKSDFFQGCLDEVWFFGRTLTPAEIESLYRRNGRRLVVVGNEGRVFQTFSDGKIWAQVPDLNVSGWRSMTRTMETLNWDAAWLKQGMLYLGGSVRAPAGSYANRIMVEGSDPGPDGESDTADDQFGNAAISGGGSSGYKLHISGLAGDAAYVTAVDSAGAVYRQDASQSAGQSFNYLADTKDGLNDVCVAGTPSQYIAVGNNGVVLRGLSGSPDRPESGVTENLLALSLNESRTPSLHVVGGRGTYLTSDDDGANWVAVEDGLTGNMRGVDVMPDQNSSDGYHVWAVGEKQTINYRPPTAPNGPFLTFYPGKLDFGFVTAGKSRTLTMELANRGQQTVAVGSFEIQGPAANRFSFGQTSISSLRPGDRTKVAVRYKPGVGGSSYDGAEFVLATSDGAATFRVPLEGRSGGDEWQPIAVPVMESGEAVDGTVPKIVFTSTNRGYAVVSTAGGKPFFYRTDDGGATWTNSAFGGYSTLESLKVLSMDAVRYNGSDLVMVGGYLEDSLGHFVEGILLKSDLPIDKDALPVWGVCTPIPSGKTDQGLKIQDVSFLHTPTLQNPDHVWVTVSTSGNVLSDNVWFSPDSGRTWTVPGDRPNSFAGGPVALVDLMGNLSIWAASGWGVHYLGSGWWGSSSKVVSASSVLRDMCFQTYKIRGANYCQGWVVGDDGAFLLWDPGKPTGSDWYPPRDAEAFGVTDLRAVDCGDKFDVWAIGPTSVFDSQDEGLTWRLNFDAGPEADLQTVASRDAHHVWMGGSLKGKAMIWRYTAPPARPREILQMADFTDFGTLYAGDAVTNTLVVKNVGTDPVHLHEVSVESDEPRSRFQIVGVPPTEIPAGGQVLVNLTFDTSSEPSLAEGMNPEFFARFEQEWNATQYSDDSTHGRHANVPASPAARPHLATSPLRDRCLYFDGGDYLEINEQPGPASSSAFAVSVWVAPDALNSDAGVILAKDSASGLDQFQLALSAKSYVIKMQGTTAEDRETPPLEWQHLVVNCTEADGATTIELYRDGVRLFTQTVAVAIGDWAGKPWILGADWTSGSLTGHGLNGSIDDVALFSRALTLDEISRLGAKSPLYGAHRARLVVNSGCEGGTQTMDLRALVGPKAEMVTFETDPQGLPVTVDGRAYSAPVSFAVVPYASTAPGAREWVIGSRHKVEATDSKVLGPAGSAVNYVFSEWSLAASRIFEYTAATNTVGLHMATYVARDVAGPLNAGPRARTQPVPPTQAEEADAVLTAGLKNSPKGPFLRITDGQLQLPILSANGTPFDITGDLYVSLERIHGRLTSSAINLPDTDDVHFLEVGDSTWLLDATAAGNFYLAADPPSLKLMGYDVLPDGGVKLIHVPADAATQQDEQWTVECRLKRDFRPAPGVLEFKKGLVQLTLLPQDAVAFTMDLNGGLRVLKMPDGNFALDQNVAVHLDTVNFDVSLNDLLGNSAPDSLFTYGPFNLKWGDLHLLRSEGGPISLRLTDLGFEVNGTQMATVSGSLNTAGELALSGELGTGGKVVLDPAGQVYLQKVGSGIAHFSLLLAPSRLAFETPPLTLYVSASGANGAVLQQGLSMPGMAFDSAGAFDTGKLAIPALEFDGMDISGNPGGERKNNYIRLRRNTAGKVTFTIKAEQLFWTCRQTMVLSVSSGPGPALPSVSGSFSGNFCILPQPLSLSYDPANACQFIGSDGNFTIAFGSDCAWVKNDETGWCLFGACQ